MLTNVEFLHWRSSPLTCDYQKIMIFEIVFLGSY